MPFSNALPRLTSLVLGALITSVSFSALAQSGKKSAPANDGDQTYWMDTDALNGDFGSPYGDLLKHRPRPPRVLLIRARASFVQEMLKSVEQI